MRSFAAMTMATVATAINASSFEFLQYVSKFGKQYASLDEFNMREALFKALDAEIQEWNAREDITSTMGHNMMSDWTAEEKTAIRGYTPKQSFANPTHYAPEAYVQALSTFDWCDTTNSKNKNECSPVKNQGACGSCWAFSATETVESAVSIFHDVHPVLILSPQQLVSCSAAYGNHGCNGGNYTSAWDYLKTHAQETEADYPYTSGSFGITGTCKADTAKGVVKTQSTAYHNVGHSNSDIMSAIDRQPTSVGVDASSNVFQNYHDGVITSGCGTSLDHAIVAVGYGTDAGQDYFLVRNSWGTSWGLSGFAKIGQSSTGGAPGYCGINDDPAYPDVQYPI